MYFPTTFALALSLCAALAAAAPAPEHLSRRATVCGHGTPSSGASAGTYVIHGNNFYSNAGCNKLPATVTTVDVFNQACMDCHVYAGAECDGPLRQTWTRGAGNKFEINAGLFPGGEMGQAKTIRC